MGRKKIPGLYVRNGIWHIDKTIRGRRLCESTGESDLEKAEEYLARKIEETRQAAIFGVRPKHTWRQAAIRYLEDKQHKRSIGKDAMHLKTLDPWLGDLLLEQVHIGTLRPFIDSRMKQGVKSRTINAALQVVRHCLNLAATEWLDEYGLTWLLTAPKIKLLPQKDGRKPYPLSWEEQSRLLDVLPPHLERMALFKVNTGLREQEVCRLRWDWEVQVPELNTSVFIIPGTLVKNGEDRVLVLNKVARSVIEELRGAHRDYVFSYKGKPLAGMHSTGWKCAWRKAGLPVDDVYLRGPHNLKHTFGRRLRAAGTPWETRKILLGHSNGEITTHYSGPELQELIEGANRVCGMDSRKSPALVILKQKTASSKHC